MSLYGGNWLLSADEYRRPCWVHKVTGERSYNPVDRSPLNYPMQQQQVMIQQQVPMQPRYGTAIVPQYGPPVTYTPLGMTRGFAGTIPPPLALPNTKWTERYDSRGKKYWINNITGEMSVDDPFI